MTLEQIQALTDDEIRVKVAEICGWQYTGPDDMRHVAFACWHAPSADPWQTCEPPNYPADLNACAEAFKAMRLLAQIEWHSRLYSIVRATCADNIDEESVRMVAVNATARQRCEAFLATMGKETA